MLFKWVVTYFQVNCVVMRGMNEEEICDFVALTENKVCLACLQWTLFICDVIWENPAGETKRTGSDETPHSPRSIWSEPGLFVTYEHLQKTLSSLSAQFKNDLRIKIYGHFWSSKTLFSSQKSRVSPDDVTDKSVFLRLLLHAISY